VRNGLFHLALHTPDGCVVPPGLISGLFAMQNSVSGGVIVDIIGWVSAVRRAPEQFRRIAMSSVGCLATTMSLCIFWHVESLRQRRPCDHHHRFAISRMSAMSRYRQCVLTPRHEQLRAVPRPNEPSFFLHSFRSNYDIISSSRRECPFVLELPLEIVPSASVDVVQPGSSRIEDLLEKHKNQR
jgi:hypothetical protein